MPTAITHPRKKILRFFNPCTFSLSVGLERTSGLLESDISCFALDPKRL
jgi:hypothetical protein